MSTFRLIAVLTTALSLGLMAGEPAVATEKPSTDWPNFLGPNRDGSGNDTGLLHEWPADGPPVLWKTPIGIGWASIPSLGDDVIVAAQDGPGETVRCLNAKTGKEVWNHGYALSAPTWAWGVGWDKGGTRCTPAISEKFVWTCGILGDCYCLDRKTGAVVWRRGFLDGQTPKNPGDWKGFIASPVISGNTIYWGAAHNLTDAVAVAWRADDGKDAWIFKEPLKKNQRGGNNLGTVAKFGNEECFLIQVNKDLKALRATDGKEIWKQEFFTSSPRGTGIPTPLVIGNDVLCIPDSDYAYLVEVDRANPAAEGKVVWRVNHQAKRWTDQDGYVSFYHNWVHHDGYLYGFAWPEIDMGAGFGKSPAYLICVELKTGKLMWSEPGFLQGTSLITDDGMLFVRSFQKLLLVECNPKAFTLKGKLENLHKLSNDTNPGQIDWVMPTIANGRMYLRLPTELVCYDIHDPKYKAR